MPPDVLCAVGVEVHVAGVGICFGALVAEECHHLGSEVVHPGEKSSWLDGTTSILISTDGLIGDKPDGRSRQRTVGAFWSGPRRLSLDELEPLIGPLGRQGSGHLGDENAICEVVEDRGPCGQRAAMTVGDWG